VLETRWNAHVAAVTYQYKPWELKQGCKGRPAQLGLARSGLHKGNVQPTLSVNMPGPNRLQSASAAGRPCLADVVVFARHILDVHIAGQAVQVGAKGGVQLDACRGGGVGRQADGPGRRGEQTVRAGAGELSRHPVL
jgi:hypothetical protein